MNTPLKDEPFHFFMIRTSKAFYPLALSLLVTACGSIETEPPKSAWDCFRDRNEQYSEVLSCYTSALRNTPSTYNELPAESFLGVINRNFELVSQDWSENPDLEPTPWKHSINIFIPEGATSGRALLIVNNGISIPSRDVDVRPATDFDETNMLQIAKRTGMIVISIDNVPTQYLTYTDDGVPRREDSSVAHSWRLFMQSPKEKPFSSLHVPMVGSIVKAMDLAEKELQAFGIKKFVVAGTSKRGWATWLTAIADNRVEAIAPFVIDILAMNDVMEHTKKSFGGNWPLAFHDYRSQGFTNLMNSEDAKPLYELVDPLQYKDAHYRSRLSIPKYIVNASGDDFFPPDNSNFYYSDLPGIKTFRTTPNSDHAGIRKAVADSLVTMLNRISKELPLPTAEIQIDRKLENAEEKDSDMLTVRFSEEPVEVTRWVAVNPEARDFRHACGIRYIPTALPAQQTLTVTNPRPAAGWSSSFVEARFSDGFVVTTPVQILPNTYPNSAPADKDGFCKTIPG